MNSNTFWIIIAVFAGAFMFFQLRGAGGNVSLAKEKIQQGALVVDVRTPQEFSGGHYAGAVNIPLHDLSSRAKELGATNRAIVVYCLSGGRSASAKRILQQAGFTDVTNAGGLQNLQR
jgi:phage shock protein E